MNYRFGVVAFVVLGAASSNAQIVYYFSGQSAIIAGDNQVNGPDGYIAKLTIANIANGVEMTLYNDTNTGGHLGELDLNLVDDSMVSAFVKDITLTHVSGTPLKQNTIDKGSNAGSVQFDFAVLFDESNSKNLGPGLTSVFDLTDAKETLTAASFGPDGGASDNPYGAEVHFQPDTVPTQSSWLGSPAVPEPFTLGLAACGLALAIRRRRS